MSDFLRLKEEFDKLKDMAMLKNPPSTSMTCQSKTSLGSSLGFSNYSWILDSGASNHMMPHRSKFSTYTPRLSDCKVLTAGGETLPVTGIGIVPIH